MNDCECESVDTERLMNFGDFHAGDFSRLVGKWIRPEADHSAVRGAEDPARARAKVLIIIFRLLST